MMKRISAALIICMMVSSGVSYSDMLGNPGFQVGKKNLFVGVEYSNIIHEYELDTNGLETISERINLKATTGITDWFDIFVKAGGADLTLDYQDKHNATKNFESDMNVGFGVGGRLRLLNFVDSRTRVFLQGGGYFFKTNGDIQWQMDTTTSSSTERDIKWADMYAGVGVAKRMDFIDLNFGVGFSQIKWWISDVEVTKVGSALNKVTRPERSSIESKNPIFGFIGLDFILPYEYRISAQAGIRNMDEAEFSIAISQGLERE